VQPPPPASMRQESVSLLSGLLDAMGPGPMLPALVPMLRALPPSPSRVRPVPAYSVTGGASPALPPPWFKRRVGALLTAVLMGAGGVGALLAAACGDSVERACRGCAEQARD
jgi:hypothetical protein